jgi:hypothetical protein
MPYTIDEGRFSFDCLEDRSINILTLPSEGDEPASRLVISRDALAAGEDLKGFLARQLKQLARQVQNFRELKREGGWLGSGDEGSLLSIVIYTSFRQSGQLNFQSQCVAQKPDGGVLVLTLTRGSPFDEAGLRRWKELLARFVPACHP